MNGKDGEAGNNIITGELERTENTLWEVMKIHFMRKKMSITMKK